MRGTIQILRQLLQHSSPVIGRARDLRAIEEMFDSGERLVTLVGGPGCGKTRLGLEFALKARSKYPDGVWFAELAAVSDADIVPFTVAATLGGLENPNRSLIQSIAEYLHDHRSARD